MQQGSLTTTQQRRSFAIGLDLVTMSVPQDAEATSLIYAVKCARSFLDINTILEENCHVLVPFISGGL
jgi:hypothetical protein